MAKPFAEAFYKSQAWKRCRRAYIAKRRLTDGGLCEVCHERLGYIVHHKVMLTQENITDPEIALNHDLLSYECKDCHDEHEGHGLTHGVEAVCAFDQEGNVLGILPPFERDRT